MREYRIDDLARAAGASVRNVRVYQERGLLPPPRLEGRVGWYGETHLARLRLVTGLLERGYSLANIGELLAAWEGGRDLGAVLGLEQVLTQPWTEEQPGKTTRTELRRMFGPLDEQAVDRVVELGLLQRAGRGFRVPSPALLQAGADLVAEGVPLDRVLELAEGLLGDVRSIAGRFLAVAQGVGPGTHLFQGSDVEAAVELALRLRPLARRALDAAFGLTMGQAGTEMFGQELTRLTRPREQPRQR